MSGIFRYESEKRADWTFSGYTFTKCSFLNEEKCKISASEDAAFGLYDREAFELGVRITLISVNYKLMRIFFTLIVVCSWIKKMGTLSDANVCLGQKHIFVIIRPADPRKPMVK